MAWHANMQYLHGKSFLDDDLAYGYHFSHTNVKIALSLLLLGMCPKSRDNILC